MGGVLQPAALPEMDVSKDVPEPSSGPPHSAAGSSQEVKKQSGGCSSPSTCTRSARARRSGPFRSPSSSPRLSAARVWLQRRILASLEGAPARGGGGGEAKRTGGSLTFGDELGPRAGVNVVPHLEPQFPHQNRRSDDIPVLPCTPEGEAKGVSAALAR